jgi:hypothetical protein
VGSYPPEVDAAERTMLAIAAGDIDEATASGG